MGYHHFISSININRIDYRVLISGKEKQNSKKLYSLNIEIIPEKNGSIPLANTNSKYQSRRILPSDINISQSNANVKLDTSSTKYSIPINEKNTQNNNTSNIIETSINEATLYLYL